MTADSLKERILAFLDEHGPQRDFFHVPGVDNEEDRDAACDATWQLESDGKIRSRDLRWERVPE